MGLETGTYISDLNSSNPTAADNKSQGDDHLRLIKSTVKASFPGVSGAVTSTHTELNILDGATVSTAELNYVDGVTSSIQTQLNTALAIIPSGTVMVFYQAAAPTGWTQSTAHNDKALRVVSTSGGGSGGTHGLTSPPSLTHTHTGPSHTHTGPSHNHLFTHQHELPFGADAVGGVVFYTPSNVEPFGTGGSFTRVRINYYGDNSQSGTDYYTLTSNPYVTDYTSAGGTGATGASGTGSTSSTTPTSFTPKYIDVIICSKD